MFRQWINSNCRLRAGGLRALRRVSRTAPSTSHASADRRPPLQLRAGIWLAVLLCLSLAGASPAAAAPCRALTGFVVFYDNGASLTDWMRTFHAWQDVSFDAATIRPDGSLQISVPKAALAFMRSHGLRVFLCVSNYGQTDFDGPEIGRILNSPTLTAALERNLLRSAAPYAGLNIDFEQIPTADASRFAAVLAALHHGLAAAGKALTVDVPAKTADDTWDGGYNYPAIAKAVDRVIIMAYDYSSPQSLPGPIAPAPWIARVLHYAVAYIPVAKIELGIPAYAYNWHGSQADSPTLPQVDRLMSSRGIAPSWDASADVPYFTYTAAGVKHTVYYENGRSLAVALSLARRYGVHGISMWYVGSEDASFWRPLQRYAQGLVP